MKLNPNISDFIKNKIENTKENRYILFEETDLENVEKLILETARNEQEKNELIHSANQNYNGIFLIHCLPYKVISEVVNSLAYRKQASGLQKIRETRDKYFPNWEEIQNADHIGKQIVKFNVLNFALKESYREHLDLKEEN